MSGLTQAADLARRLNDYDGDNWAQNVNGVYGFVSEESTARIGCSADRMGDPGQVTVCVDGSALRFTRGKWVVVR